MDSNEVLESTRDYGLAQFLTNNGLHDAHGNNPALLTNIQKPNRCMDHGLCTSGAYYAIKGSDTLTYGQTITWSVDLISHDGMEV